MTVEGFGEVTVDISYGGAFYAFVDAQRFGLNVTASRSRDLVDAATAVTSAVKSQVRSSRGVVRQEYLSECTGFVHEALIFVLTFWWCSLPGEVTPPNL